MDQDTLIDEVTQRTEMDSPEEVESVVGATLRVLGQRIGSGDADEIAERLPADVVGYLRMEESEAAGFPVDEFYQRVNDYQREEGLDVDEATTQEHVPAVLAALATDREIRQELRSVRGQLPDSYDTLFRQVEAEGPP